MEQSVKKLAYVNKKDIRLIIVVTSFTEMKIYFL